MGLKISKSKLIGFSGLLLLGLMMIFISQLYVIKIFLMLILLILVKKKPAKISLYVKIAYTLIFTYGIYGIFFGLLYQTPNPFLFTTIYCIYPLFFLLITTFLDKESYFKNILKVIFFSHFFILSYDLLYAWAVFSGIEIPNIYFLENAFTFHESGSRMNFVNLNTLTFSTPVLFLILIGDYKLGIPKWIQLIIMAFTFFLLIISGRRSVMLVIFSLPFLPLIFSSFFSKKIKHNIIKSSIVFALGFIITFTIVNTNYPKFIEDYTNIFLKAFDSDVEPIKFVQKKMLIEKFMENPIFGHGAGAMFYEPSPGRAVFANQFELSYHFKLASTGIVGFFLIIGVYLWVFFYGLYLAKKNNDLLFFSLLIGLFFMLIADATNPVLTSFDLIWPLYLCLAKINYWRTAPLFSNRIKISHYN